MINVACICQTISANCCLILKTHIYDIISNYMNNLPKREALLLKQWREYLNGKASDKQKQNIRDSYITELNI